MTKCRVSEIFGGEDPNAVAPVIQGEGLYSGKPSIFVRFFGCNFRCRAFGIKEYVPGSENQEVQEIIRNIHSYNSLHDLPLVKTGCDSYFSIYPKFKKFSKDWTPEELVQEIVSRRPKTAISQHDVIFTGGEPLLNQTSLKEILPLLAEQKQQRITFETNGTISLSPSLLEVMNETKKIHYLWSVSPKLSSSGHTFFEAFEPKALRTYNKISNSTLVLKFVVSKDNFDFKELMKFIKGYSLEGIEIDEIFLMPEGGVQDERYQENRAFAAELCSLYGFRYSPRLQLELFGNLVGV